MKERRVGTVTFGVSLVVFGILFLVRTIWTTFDYSFIFHFWPLMLIMLGGEILYYCIRYKEVHFKYDIAALFLAGLIVIFAMGMAGVEFVMDNYPKFINL